MLPKSGYKYPLLVKNALGKILGYFLIKLSGHTARDITSHILASSLDVYTALMVVLSYVSERL